jgi:hypothetical protein
LIRGVRLENGHLMLDGYPVGATAHPMDSPDARDFRRLAAFGFELQEVVYWLDFIPSGAPNESHRTFAALADAALIGFCRCFDPAHPLNPLKQNMLSLEQRDQLERLRKVRNKLVAHNERLSDLTLSLIVRSKELTAIEVVALDLSVPFICLPEMEMLRNLSRYVLDWVATEREKIASKIVQEFNALPALYRAAAPPVTINIESKDHYAPRVERARRK